MKLTIQNLCKTYQSTHVLNNLCLELYSDKIYGIMAPSGFGKTTLFRILLGLECPDSGILQYSDSPVFSAVFQEDRMCEAFTAFQNLRLALPSSISDEDIRSAFSFLLPEDSLSKPVFTFSGGMKRRLSFLRCLLMPANVLILDEPFTGMDAEIVQQACSFLKDHANGKLILISSHHEEDLMSLGAEIIHLDESVSQRN